MAITIDGTNGLTTDNAALKLDGTTLVVDNTNNRVGIGTASPSGLLDIEGATATQYINATSGNANTFYQLAGTTTGSIEVGGGNSVYVTANNASGHIYLRTGGANIRMTIDSSGRVTMPYQPMFSAHTYSSNGTVNGNLTNISFGTVLVNQGSHWNNTTGAFTCPVAGKYLVILNLNLRSSTTNWLGAYVTLNNATVFNGWSRDAINFDYQPALCSGIISCQANDTIALTYNNGYSTPAGSNNYNHALIQLVG